MKTLENLEEVNYRGGNRSKKKIEKTLATARRHGLPSSAFFII